MTAVTIPVASPRLHTRHQRHAIAARKRHSKQLTEWLLFQAARLSTTPTVLLGKLDTFTADQIAAATDITDLR